LMLLAGVRERQGKSDDAKRVYADLIARYPQSPFAADAKQRMGGSN
jgi:TolA-binding protein